VGRATRSFGIKSAGIGHGHARESQKKTMKLPMKKKKMNTAPIYDQDEEKRAAEVSYF